MSLSRCSQPSGISSRAFHLSQELLKSVRISPQSSISPARPAPYNPLGLAMYPLLGKPVPCLPPGFTAPEHERDLVKTFREIVAEKTRQHVSRLTVAH